MAAFATFAVGFVSRPLGGIVFGHFGDRVGRKTALVTTLVMMGTATFLIGVLPTYQTAGILSPVLLVVLRLVQGFAVGGEWGGAALITVEHAPEHRKTFYGAFTQLGSPGGTVLSTAAFSLATVIGGGVAEVMVDGQWIMRDRAVRGIDERAVLDRLQRSAADVWRRWPEADWAGRRLDELCPPTYPDFADKARSLR